MSDIKKSFKLSIILYIFLYITINIVAASAIHKSMSTDLQTNTQWVLNDAKERVNIFFVRNRDLLTLVTGAVSDMLENEESMEKVEEYISNSTNSYLEEVESNVIDVFGSVQGNYISGRGYVPSEGYIPEERLWYKQAMENPEETILSSPYIDQQTGRAMISLSKSLPNNNGVIASTVYLKNILDASDTAFSEGVTEVYFITPEGLVIHQGKEQPSYVEINRLEELTEKKSKLFTEMMDVNSEIDHHHHVYSASFFGKKQAVFHEDLNGGWHMVMFIPRLHNLRDYMGYFWTAFIASTIALAIILFITSRNIGHRLFAENQAEKLKASASIYYVLFSVNLEQNTIEKLKDLEDSEENTAYAEGMQINKGFKNEKHLKADEYIRYLAETNTHEVYLERVLGFVDFSTLRRRLRNKKTITIEFVDKYIGWARARFVIASTDEDGMPATVLFAVESIDEEKKREHVLRQLSETDGLTGINNRFAGEKAVSEFLESGIQGMFYLFDVDKFKSINDNFGHMVGDKVLIEIANVLKTSFRDNDVVMRLGGDEFAAYLVGITTEEESEKQVKRLFEKVDAIDIPELGDRKIHISMGATPFLLDNARWECFGDIYTRADKGTYESKTFQGNKCTYRWKV